MSSPNLTTDAATSNQPSSQPVRHVLPSSALRSILSELRHTMMFLAGSASVIWGFLAFVGVVCLAAAIDLALDLSPNMRLLTWGAALAVFGGVLFKLISRARQQAAPEQMAKRLDECAQSGGQIRTGLDLMSRLSPREPELSRGLAAIAVHRAARLASEVPTHRVVPFRPAGIAIGFFCLALASAAVVAFAAPRLVGTEWWRFVDPHGDHPAYSPYEFEIRPENATVPYGAELDVTVRVNGPATRQMELVLIPPESQRNQRVEDTKPLAVLPMFLRSDGEWGVALAELSEPVDMYARVHRARSKVAPVQVQTVPLFSEVRFVMTPPAYSGLPPVQGILPVSGVAALRDSTLRIILRSNRPLSTGRLDVITDEPQTVHLTPQSDPHEVAGEFQISQAGRIDLQMTDLEGQPSYETRSIPIRLLQDQHPVVRLTQPRAVSFATPTAMLPVTVAAEDDYGLSRAQLYRSLNDSRSRPANAALESTGQRRLQWTSNLPLADYGVQPGDEIKLFARAEDNDPYSPAAPIGKGSECPIVTVRIISQEEFDQLQRERIGMQNLTAKYDQARRRLEKLIDQMDKLRKSLENEPADSPLSEIRREELAQLANELADQSEEIRKLADQKLPLDLDKHLNPKLAEMAKKLKELSEQLKQQSAQPPGTPADARETLQKQLEKLRELNQQHRQEVTEPIEWLKQSLAMKQNEATFVRLVQRQRDLADRLSSLKTQAGQDDPAAKARMRSFEEEQRRNQMELAGILQQIEEDAHRLPEDERLEKLRSSALEFVEAVRSSPADQQMGDAEQSLAKFDGMQGYESALNAAKTLEQFLSQCQGMGDEAGNCLPSFSPGSSLASALSSTLQQLSPSTGMAGQGAGGGFSSQMSTMDNVGLYGSMPLLGGSGLQEENNPTGGPGLAESAFSTGSNADGNGFQTQQANPAYGGADWGVPARYRRQSGRYLQRLADELDE